MSFHSVSIFILTNSRRRTSCHLEVYRLCSDHGLYDFLCSPVVFYYPLTYAPLVHKLPAFTISFISFPLNSINIGLKLLNVAKVIEKRVIYEIFLPGSQFTHYLNTTLLFTWNIILETNTTCYLKHYTWNQRYILLETLYLKQTLLITWNIILETNAHKSPKTQIITSPTKPNAATTFNETSKIKNRKIHPKPKEHTFTTD